MPTMEERYKDDILSDNTQIDYCVQCKDCIFWCNNDADYYSNAYDKACCDMYPFPEFKPDFVLNNTGECEYKETL